MAGKTQTGSAEPEKSREAKNLAEEALEEIKHGNKEEGQFLADEAKQLDPATAEGVLKGAKAKDAKGGGKASSGEGRSGSEGNTTTDHDRIREWVEARKGRPCVVRATEGKDHSGILRIEFNEDKESLDTISWDEFFETFEDRGLAFLHQDKTADGRVSRFFKFIRREED